MDRFNMDAIGANLPDLERKLERLEEDKKKLLKRLEDDGQSAQDAREVVSTVQALIFVNDALEEAETPAAFGKDRAPGTAPVERTLSVEKRVEHLNQSIAVLSQIEGAKALVPFLQGLRTSFSIVKTVFFPKNAQTVFDENLTALARFVADAYTADKNIRIRIGRLGMVETFLTPNRPTPVELMKMAYRMNIPSLVGVALSSRNYIRNGDYGSIDQLIVVVPDDGDPFGVLKAHIDSGDLSEYMLDGRMLHRIRFFPKTFEIAFDRGARIGGQGNPYFWMAVLQKREMFIKIHKILAKISPFQYRISKDTLYVAIEKGVPDVLKTILDFGNLDVNTFDDARSGRYSQFPPLLFAVQKLNESMVSKLIELGADVNETEKQSQTALHFLMSKTTNLNREFESFILEWTKKLHDLDSLEDALEVEDPEDLAREKRNIERERETVRLEIEQEDRIFTKRMETVPRIAAILLDNGADPNARDADNNRAIDLLKNAPAMFEFLQGRGIVEGEKRRRTAEGEMTIGVSLLDAIKKRNQSEKRAKKTRDRFGEQNAQLSENIRNTRSLIAMFNDMSTMDAWLRDNVDLTAVPLDIGEIGGFPESKVMSSLVSIYNSFPDLADGMTEDVSEMVENLIPTDEHIFLLLETPYEEAVPMPHIGAVVDHFLWNAPTDIIDLFGGVSLKPSTNERMELFSRMAKAVHYVTLDMYNRMVDWPFDIARRRLLRTIARHDDFGGLETFFERLEMAEVEGPIFDEGGRLEDGDTRALGLAKSPEMTRLLVQEGAKYGITRNMIVRKKAVPGLDVIFQRAFEFPIGDDDQANLERVTFLTQDNLLGVSVLADGKVELRVDSEGRNMLHSWSEHNAGYRLVLLALVEQANNTPDLVLMPHDTGFSFHTATRLHDSLDVSRFLIERIAQFRENKNKELDRFSPILLKAVRKGDVDFVKLLLEFGADVNIRGSDALFIATGVNHNDAIARALVDKGANVDSLFKKVADNAPRRDDFSNFDQMQRLIKLGADVNGFDADGEWPLLKSIRRMQKVLARFLIRVGADMNLKSAKGESILSYLIMRHEIGAIELAIELGADVNAKDEEDGFTPAFTLLSLEEMDDREKLFILDVLKKAGADLNATEEDGRTLLAMSVLFKEFEIFRRLVSEGVDVDKVGDDGSTPLEIAARKGFVRFARVLIEAGADANPEFSSQDELPLFIALDHKHEEMSVFLVKHTKNLQEQDFRGNTALMKAVTWGSLSLIESLTGPKSNSTVNTENDDSEIPLHRAAATRRVEIVSYLVSQGSDINKQTRFERTPLIQAARHGNLAVVDYLLDKGADTDLKMDGGRSALSEAAFHGKLSVVRGLVEFGMDPRKKDNDGRDSLGWAVISRSLEMVKFLVGLDMNVDEDQGDGLTPLMLSSSKPNIDIVKFLVESGANVNAKDIQNKTALHLISNLEIVKFLVQSGAIVDSKTKFGRTPLLKSLATGNVELVKFLVESGANVNVRDERGVTPLLRASYNSKPDIDIVRFLVESGANINVKDEDGTTPLYNALGDQRGESVSRFLVGSGANINEDDERGVTPFMRAVHWGHTFFIDFLINSGARVGDTDNSGWTALHHSSLNTTDKKRIRQLIQTLVDKGIAVDARADDDRTPLHVYAARSARPPGVQKLVELGADVHAEDDLGEVPMHKAVKSGRIGIIRAIFEAGGKFDKKNNEGKTPYDFAAQKSVKAAVEKMRRSKPPSKPKTAPKKKKKRVKYKI